MQCFYLVPPKSRWRRCQASSKQVMFYLAFVTCVANRGGEDLSALRDGGEWARRMPGKNLDAFAAGAACEHVRPPQAHQSDHQRDWLVSPLPLCTLFRLAHRHWKRAQWTAVNISFGVDLPFKLMSLFQNLCIWPPRTRNILFFFFFFSRELKRVLKSMEGT